MIIKTAKEFFHNDFEKSNCFIDFDTEGYKVIQKSMIEFAKLHVETALKAASNKFDHYSNKEAVLNAYDLNNIK